LVACAAILLARLCISAGTIATSLDITDTALPPREYDPGGRSWSDPQSAPRIPTGWFPAQGQATARCDVYDLRPLICRPSPRRRVPGHCLKRGRISV
jgi:hypothetical protein